MNDPRIAFVGAGNMTRSLIGGLIADGRNPARLCVSDPDTHQLSAVASRFQVHTDTDNQRLTENCDVVVLAVKPQVMATVARALGPSVQHRQPLVISVAAGIRTADLERWLGGRCALVRCMPNTPALVQSGATALFATEGVSPPRRDLAESLLRAVGLTLWVEDEALMDAVTAVSGSGPAYFFLLIEALQEAGEALGLGRKSARLLALQTAFGAAKMALESSDDAAILRQRVTSPGGTTQAALEVLESGAMKALLQSAVTAARDRSRALAQQLGAD